MSSTRIGREDGLCIHVNRNQRYSNYIEGAELPKMSIDEDELVELACDKDFLTLISADTLYDFLDDLGRESKCKLLMRKVIKKVKEHIHKLY